MKIITSSLFCVVIGLSSCENLKKEESASAALLNERSAEKVPYESSTGMLDTLGLCYDLVREKSVNEFLKNQPNIFTVTIDTVYNDERGLVIGKKLVADSSFIQWYNDSSVVRMLINDKRVKLNYGIQVGMSKSEFKTKFKLGVVDFDTFSFDSGFLQNGCDLYFSKGALRKIELINEGD